MTEDEWEALDYASTIVSGYLEELQHLFAPSMKLVFLAFDPDEPEADFCATSADLEDLLRAVERLRERERKEGSKYHVN